MGSIFYQGSGIKILGKKGLRDQNNGKKIGIGGSRIYHVTTLVLDLINTLISTDDNSTRYILLPNAIICKLEVLHDPVPSFVSRSLPYCQVVGL